MDLCGLRPHFCSTWASFPTDEAGCTFKDVRGVQLKSRTSFTQDRLQAGAPGTRAEVLSRRWARGSRCVVQACREAGRWGVGCGDNSDTPVSSSSSYFFGNIFIEIQFTCLLPNSGGVSTFTGLCNQHLENIPSP